MQKKKILKLIEKKKMGQKKKAKEELSNKEIRNMLG